MVMTETVARNAIIFGIMEMVEAGIGAVLSAVLIGLVSQGGASNGLWTLVYGIPGILMILGGKYKNTAVMGVALGFNVVATILALFAFIGYITIWGVISGECDKSDRSSEIDCSKKSEIIGLVAGLTIIILILLITSFISCILGCMGTCCAPKDPVVIRATSHPSTIVVNSQLNRTQYPEPYNKQMAPRAPDWSASAQHHNVLTAPRYGDANIAMAHIK